MEKNIAQRKKEASVLLKVEVISSKIRHNFPEECNGIRIFLIESVKSNVVFLFTVDMTYRHDRLH